MPDQRGAVGSDAGGGPSAGGGAGLNLAAGRQSRAQRRLHRLRRREQRHIKRSVSVRRHLYRFLRVVIRVLFDALFGLRAENAEIINRHAGACVLLGNHSSVLDPFFVGTHLTRPIHYVASDSQFRNRFMGWFLQLMGTIPKTKALSDLDTVKKIIEVRRTGGMIGVFPEGQSTWDGHSLPLVPATAKLLKSLKVPVFVAQVRGAYFTWPRWGRGFRRGRVLVRYSRLFDAGDLKALALEEVVARLEEAMTFDATAAQREDHFRYLGPRRAEYLERVLFACPNCHALHSLASHGTRVTCDACRYEVRLMHDGRFEPVRGPLHFDTIPGWNQWQLTLLDHLLTVAATASRSGVSAPLFAERTAAGEGYRTQPLQPLGTGTLQLWPDQISFHPDGASPMIFAVHAVVGANIQNNEHLEFYVEDHLYRFSPIDPRTNTYKWYIALTRLATLARARAVPAG